MIGITGYTVLFVTVCVFNLCSCHHGRPFPPYWSLRRVSMSGAVLKTSETRNMYQCQYLCWVTSPCGSVTFSTSTRLCSLYTDIPGDSDITFSRTDITSSASENDVNDWSSDCHLYSCENGSVCVSSDGGHICLSPDCGTPTDIANATVTYPATTVYSIVHYNCAIGYNFQGSSSQAVCEANEVWTGLSGYCLIVSCTVPSGISNADVTYPALTYNSIATYTCHVGYNFQGTSNKATCGADGQWSGLSGNCQIVSCTAPSGLSNADMTYTALTYNSISTYTCHVGYNFQGSSNEATCGADGQWSGLSGNCQIVSCAVPSDISDAVVTYSTLTYNSIATYTCDVGYNFQGSSKQAVCGASGQWAGPSGSCQIVSCSIPTPLSNADVTYPALTYTSIATYTCDIGYNFLGSSNEATCGANGQWSGLSGSCQIVSCIVPTNILNAVVAHLALTYNSIATYSCIVGFSFQGASNQATCGANGQWSGLSGSCQVVTCAVPSGLAKGSVLYSTLTHNSIATYTCYVGYNFQGPSKQATCGANGQWSGLSGSCQIVSCAVPSGLSNGGVTYSTLTYNSVATYTCDVGYNFQGLSKDATCGANGQWSGLSGSCQIVSCNVPSGLSNAIMTYSTLTYGSTATYTCNGGYSFQGSSRHATCNANGQWSGLSGSCQSGD